jgi:hypothetical protein
MKKLEKLFEERTLICDKGKEGTRNHERMVISASKNTQGDYVFKIAQIGGISGSQAETTIVLANVKAAMLAFNPKASAWKVSRKPKAVKPAKVKAEKVTPVAVVIKKGRG